MRASNQKKTSEEIKVLVTKLVEIKKKQELAISNIDKLIQYYQLDCKHEKVKESFSTYRCLACEFCGKKIRFYKPYL